jgi:hypothetical protein
MTMGNRSRYHASQGRNREREYQRARFHAFDEAVHLLLVDLPDSGVTEGPDGGMVCDGETCHGCTLERAGFARLASIWVNAEQCEDHS